MNGGFQKNVLPLNTRALAAEILDRQQLEMKKQAELDEKMGKKQKSTKRLFGWKNTKPEPEEAEDLEQLRSVHGQQICSHMDTRGAGITIGQGHAGKGHQSTAPDVKEDSTTVSQLMQDINHLEQGNAKPNPSDDSQNFPDKFQGNVCSCKYQHVINFNEH